MTSVLKRERYQGCKCIEKTPYEDPVRRHHLPAKEKVFRSNQP